MSREEAAAKAWREMGRASAALRAGDGDAVAGAAAAWKGAQDFERATGRLPRADEAMAAEMAHLLAVRRPGTRMPAIPRADLEAAFREVERLGWAATRAAEEGIANLAAEEGAAPVEVMETAFGGALAALLAVAVQRRPAHLVIPARVLLAQVGVLRESAAVHAAGSLPLRYPGDEEPDAAPLEGPAPGTDAPPAGEAG